MSESHQFQCQTCGSKLDFPSNFEGQTVQCDQCGLNTVLKKINIPQAAANTPDKKTDAPQAAANTPVQIELPPATQSPTAVYVDSEAVGQAPPPPIGQAPPPPSTPEPIGSNQDVAQAAVSGPATFMMVLAILNIVVMLVGLAMNLFFGGLGLAALDAGAEPEGVQLIMQGVGGVIGNILGIITSILILVGAIKMRKLQSYGLSMTACILSILCCTCCIGIGPGIWGIVVLCKPEVKSAFH